MISITNIIFNQGIANSAYHISLNYLFLALTRPCGFNNIAFCYSYIVVV